ncbi:MAG: hypothetical protein NT131_05980 [Methanomassiliicoccales archaeon]|nr:hypothetical protein [Methanomassiliicoccales archaeon]
MRSVENAGWTLIGAGFVAIIVDAFYDIYATLAVGTLCIIILTLYMLWEDFEDAIAGGLLGLILFAVTLILSPIVCIVAGFLIVAALRMLK